MTVRQRAEWAAAVVVVSCCLAATGLGSWWLWFDASLRPPFTDMGRATFTTLGGDPVDGARPGEYFLLHRYFCRHRPTPGQVEARWTDGVIYSEPATPTAAADLGCRVRQAVKRVPAVPPREYIYEIAVTVDLNPLRTIRVPFPPSRFVVYQ